MKIKYFCLTILFVLTVFAAFLSAFTFSTLFQLQGIKSLEQYQPSVITRVLDTKGRLISEFYKERREVVSFNEISPNLIKATLSAEDKRFFSHYGIDVGRIIKALFVNVASLKKEQGGSTITIQLSKLLFLHYKKTFERKIRELWYTIQVEKQYTKAEILNFYFNQINYGHGSYGVKAAAKFFFNKSIKDISIAEAALLSSIPKSPVYYSPIRYPKRAMQRHKVILMSMVNNGYISKATAYKEYKEFWLLFSKKIRNQQATFSDFSKNKAPYFTEYIRKKVEKTLDKQTIYSKGLNIYTTLNLDQQKVAQEYLWKALKQQDQEFSRSQRIVPNGIIEELKSQISHFSLLLNLPNSNFYPDLVNSIFKQIMEDDIQEPLKNISAILRFNQLHDYVYQDFKTENNTIINKNKVQGAIIAIEPNTGHITTMVGGTPFNYNNQFNRTIHLKRQVGSLLKPFIYAIAIDNNILTASTILKDTPLSFNGYIPKNYNGYYRGEVLVRDALRKSINVTAVDTLDRISIKKAQTSLFQIFRAFSKTSQEEMFPNNLTLALGSGSFSPLSMATAYAVIANEGREVIPKTIRYITDTNGEMIKDFSLSSKKENRQLVNPTTAFIIADIITDVFTPGGTAFFPDLLKDFQHKKQSFGKTGTSSNWTDAWFAGANKYLSTVVWMGYDNNQSLGRKKSGSRKAAPIWINFQKEVLKHKPKILLQQPKGVVKKKVSRFSGKLVGPYCTKNEIYFDYFKIDNYPKEVCDYHSKSIEEKITFKTFLNKSKSTKRQIKSIINSFNKQ